MPYGNRVESSVIQNNLEPLSITRLNWPMMLYHSLRALAQSCLLSHLGAYFWIMSAPFWLTLD